MDNYALYVGQTLIDILPKSNNLSWTSDKDALSVQLSWDSIYDFEDGTFVALLNNGEEIFRGLVVSKTKKRFTNNYIAWDYGFYLAQNETTIQFNGLAADDAIKQLCGKVSIPCEIVKIDYLLKAKIREAKEKKQKATSTNEAQSADSIFAALGIDSRDIETSKFSTIITSKVKKSKNIKTNTAKIYKGQTYANIIDDILKQAEQELFLKFFKEMQGSTLIIMEQSDCKIAPKVVIGKDTVLNTSIENMRNRVEVVSSEEKNINVLAVSEDTNNESIYGRLTKVVSVDDKNESQARNIAENTLKENNKIFKNITLPMIALEDGDDIRANRLIELNIPSMGLSGWHRIKSAQHSLQNNIHKVNVEIEE